VQPVSTAFAVPFDKFGVRFRQLHLRFGERQLLLLVMPDCRVRAAISPESFSSISRCAANPAAAAAASCRCDSKAADSLLRRSSIRLLLRQQLLRRILDRPMVMVDQIGVRASQSRDRRGPTQPLAAGNGRRRRPV